MIDNAALHQERELHIRQAEIIDRARDILVKEGLPLDDYHLDVVLHAMFEGVQIGLTDQELSRQFIIMARKTPVFRPGM